VTSGLAVWKAEIQASWAEPCEEAPADPIWGAGAVCCPHSPCSEADWTDVVYLPFTKEGECR
jgi:hypothetical protein